LLRKAVESEKPRVAKRPSASLGRQPRFTRSFIDTNLLLYCEDAATPAKQAAALELVLEHKRQRTGVVSVQVLEEYFVNATLKLGVDPALARQKVEIYARFHVVEPSVGDILAAIDFHRLHGVSFWDALVIRSARQSGCKILLTEGLQHHQTIDGVTIVNPFL